MSAQGPITITVLLTPDQAAGLLRFAEKSGHSDALAALYPHVPREIRSEQAYSILGACQAVERALGDAGVGTWPWIETGQA